MSSQTLPPGVATVDACTYETCSIAIYGQLTYRPSLGGNALCVAVFGICLVAQVILGVRYKTWGYLTALLCGTLLEVIGYIGRILLWSNDFSNNDFIMYLVCLTIGPAFYSAALYLCFSRIIAIFGRDFALLNPRTITLIFIGSDFLSLVLQAAGGAIAATQDDDDPSQTGPHIMVAGLSTQVASMATFIALCVHLGWMTRRHPSEVNPNSADLRRAKRFKLFLWALAVATVCIFVRCCFRVAELSNGFNSALANNQVEFMILEATMVMIAIIALTVGHPGPALGQAWETGAFTWRKRNSSLEGTEKVGMSVKSGGMPSVAAEV